MSSTTLEIELRELAGAAVVTARGVLDRSTYEKLRSALVKCAVDEPRAVIADLSGVEVLDSASFALFAQLSAQLSDWPGLPLLLVTGSGHAAARLPSHVRRFVRVCSSVPEAITHIGERPVRRAVRRALPNGFAATALCRRFVQETCARWHVAAEDTEDAAVIAGELVENTLVHTYCAPELRLELRRGLLTVAVSDDDPTPAEPRARQDGHGGLALVAALARIWGCEPTMQGGKVVWAVLRVDAR
ncbi:MAG TPA: STAS domain-containing protein [Actinophytocola sp.]|jgi:anti-anti-sigma factor|uniref:STAS domain-containing protein n=1 Tax=Actinophytocola sp. TaxID=1872138 RepID=UPI002F928944